MVYQDISLKICLSLFGWKENIVPKMHIVQCGSWTFSLSPSQWRRGPKQGNFKAQKKSCHWRGYGWDFLSRNRNTLHRCPHKVLRSPILPALYQPWTTVVKDLTQPGEVPQHVKVVGFERLPSELIQYVYRIDWYRHSAGYLLHLERRIRAFTTGVPGQLLTTLHWWILVPHNCSLWTLQVKSSCRDISKT